MTNAELVAVLWTSDDLIKNIAAARIEALVREHADDVAAYRNSVDELSIADTDRAALYALLDWALDELERKRRDRDALQAAIDQTALLLAKYGVIGTIPAPLPEVSHEV